MPLQIYDGGNKHPGAAARGVVDGFAGFGLKYLRHEMHHCAVGIELLRRVTAVIGKLLDEILIALPQFIFRAVFKGQCVLAEMLQQVF